MFSGVSEYPVACGEPMTLGSPTGSPANIPGPGASPFLPGYLMGETGSLGGTPGSRIWAVPGSLSPTKGRPTSVASIPSNLSPQKSLMSPVVQTSSVATLSRGYIRQTSSDKHGGPPVQGLFDNFSSPAIQSPSFCSVSGSPSLRSAPNILSPNTSFDILQTPNKSSVPEVKFPPSPAQLDPFYSQRETLKSDDLLDETWITVFGFPPAAASYILQQFYHYGNIIEHKMSPNGNWMHIRYQTKLQAKIALSKNGKIFSNNVMVGVAPCIDKNVMNASRSNISTEVNRSNNSFHNRSLSHNPIASSPSSLAFQYAGNDTSIIQSNSIPRKSTGLVSKAMEYLFGW